MEPDQSKSPEPSNGRFQFRLITLMLAMALVSVPAALFGGMRAKEGNYRARFVLLTLIVPVGLLLFFALGRMIFRRRKKRRRRW